MLAEQRVYASPYTYRVRIPSLSPLAGREQERGVPLFFERETRKNLSQTLLARFHNIRLAMAGSYRLRSSHAGRG
jgi:hypothetical protein